MTIAIAVGPHEHIIFLKASWKAYETLSNDISEDSHALLAYDGETLELMSPTTEHEAYARLIDALLTLLSQEWDVNLYSTGSSTLHAEPVGAEPDTSYYINSASAVDGLAKIDLHSSPPPDLVVEVDLSQRRIDKLTLYARIGVSEFWRYSRQGLQGFALVDGAFVEAPVSRVIAGLPFRELARFLERRLESNRRAVFADWTAWLRENRPVQN